MEPTTDRLGVMLGLRDPQATIAAELQFHREMGGFRTENPGRGDPAQPPPPSRSGPFPSYSERENVAASG